MLNNSLITVIGIGDGSGLSASLSGFKEAWHSHYGLTSPIPFTPVAPLVDERQEE